MVNLDPFVIAEIGINHQGNIKRAYKLIDAAKKSGASAVKFQTYITENRVSKNSPIFKILKKCELPFEAFKTLKKYCSKKKIIFFSTPFDKESVVYLDKIGVEMFKIASFNISHYQLINEIIKTKKPTIISTGMASLKEIKKITKKFESKKIKHCLLHCISSYPNKEEDSFLNNIPFLIKNFNCKVGLSDHTNDINTSIYSYILGATIIEKHFKLSDKDKCVDSAVSITPKQMFYLVNKIKEIKRTLGNVKFGVRKVEKNTQQYKVITR